jgi:hypothetical protein
MSTFDRYSLEGEWAPVRYARVRSVYRFTDTEFPPSMDEHEAFIEFQFSY